ncbi:MAG TPA: serine hydrolase [Chthoniobacterales bacterium]|jgi:D-alanyl-D-alanine carboxypeptidase|nr:serine hydrolase [Chthoniobacterales bacterium]
MIFPRFFVAFFCFAVAFPAARSLHAAAAHVILDAQTGHVLEQANPRDKRQIGSLTKVAAAMVVLDWSEKRGGDLNQFATIPPEAFVGTGDNLIGFQPGDRVTLRDLLYAALVQSDNIAAFTLAHHVGIALQPVVPSAGNGTPVAIFVGQMNFLAKSLRMERTRFVNPHGIDTGERSMPFSTASDLGRLSRYAVNKAAFRFYVSQKERQISFSRGESKKSYLLRNTNELLGANGVDGVKTGRTARAGDCLILSAHRESQIVKGAGTTVIPRHLIVIMLGSPNRFGEGAALLARGWQLHEQWLAGGRLTDPNKTL